MVNRWGAGTLNTGAGRKIFFGIMELFMDVRLQAGAITIGISIIMYAICYLGARNPKQPFWAGETMMANLMAPALTTGFTVGPMFIIEYLFVHWGQLSMIDLAAATAIIAASVVIVKMMHIGKRVERFTNSTGSSNTPTAPLASGASA